MSKKNKNNNKKNKNKGKNFNKKDGNKRKSITNSVSETAEEKGFFKTIKNFKKNGIHGNTLTLNEYEIKDLSYELEFELDIHFRYFAKIQAELSKKMKLKYEEVPMNHIILEVFKEHKKERETMQETNMLKMIAFAWENIDGMKGKAYFDTLYDYYYFTQDFTIIKEMLKKK